VPPRGKRVRGSKQKYRNGGEGHRPGAQLISAGKKRLKKKKYRTSWKHVKTAIERNLSNPEGRDGEEGGPIENFEGNVKTLSGKSS